MLPHSRRYFYLLLYCIFAAGYAYAQGNTDSLEKLLPSLKQDTSRLRVLLDLSWQLKTNNPDKALSFGNQAIQIARKVKDKESESNAMSSVGIAYSSRGDYEKATEIFFQSLKIKEELAERDPSEKNRLALASCYNNIANV